MDFTMSSKQLNIPKMHLKTISISTEIIILFWQTAAVKIGFVKFLRNIFN